MSSFDHFCSLLLRFRHREDTYKTRERARRAFYRWVCKEGLYRTMQRHVDYAGRPYCARTGGPGFHYSAPYRDGYPVFRAWRSDAYSVWASAFAPVRARWEAEAAAIRKAEYTKWQTEQDAASRAFDVVEGHDYFEVAAAAEALGKL